MPSWSRSVAAILRGNLVGQSSSVERVLVQVRHVLSSVTDALPTGVVPVPGVQVS